MHPLVKGTHLTLEMTLKTDVPCYSGCDLPEEALHALMRHLTIQGTV